MKTILHSSILLFFLLSISLLGFTQNKGYDIFPKNYQARELFSELRKEIPFKERLKDIEKILKNNHSKIRLKKSRKTKHIYEAKLDKNRSFIVYFDEQNRDVLLEYVYPINKYSKVFDKYYDKVFNDKFITNNSYKDWYLNSADNCLLNKKEQIYIKLENNHIRVGKSKSKEDFNKLFDNYKSKITAFAPDKSFKYGFNLNYSGEIKYYKEYFPDGSEKSVYHGKIINGKREDTSAKFIIFRKKSKVYSSSKLHPIFGRNIFIEKATFKNDKLVIDKPIVAKFSNGSHISYKGYLDENYKQVGDGKIEVKPTNNNKNHFIIEGNFDYNPKLIYFSTKGLELGKDIVIKDIKNKLTIKGEKILFENFFSRSLNFSTNNGYLYFDETPNIRYQGIIYLGNTRKGTTKNCVSPFKEIINSYTFPKITLERKNLNTGQWVSTYKDFEFNKTYGCIELSPQTIAQREKNKKDRIEQNKINQQKEAELALIRKKQSAIKRDREREKFAKSLIPKQNKSNNSSNKNTQGLFSKSYTDNSKNTAKQSLFSKYVKEQTSKPTITVENKGNTRCYVKLEITNGKFVGGQSTATVNVGPYSSKQIFINSSSKKASVTFTPCQGSNIIVKRNF